MAKTRSLPDKFYDKDYEHNGIHRVPLWRIAGYALNNTATNVYLMMMNYATYYLMGWVGVGMMVASSLTMMMRIWDGVTDPFVGFMVDKTNGKFGKNRPFIVIGQIIMFVTTFVMFNFIPKMGTGVRFVAFIIIYMIYILDLPDQRPQAAPHLRNVRYRVQHHPDEHCHPCHRYRQPGSQVHPDC